MKLGKIGLTGLIFILISYLGKIAIYPCKVSAVIQFPVYTWKLFQMSILRSMYTFGIHEMYFGFNAGKYLGLVLNLVVAYLVVSLTLYLYKKYKK